jgi:hypothetical protein
MNEKNQKFEFDDGIFKPGDVMSELAANGNTISCEIQKKLFDNKVKIMIVIVLSVVVVRKKEPPLSSTDIKGFQAEDHFEKL